MDFGFNTKDELYERVKPALNIKRRELHRLGYDHITNEDIWNYLIDNKWIKEKDITLADLVNDILNINNHILINYLKENIKTIHETLYLEK